MIIYGTAILSLCLLIGLSLGRFIGKLLGVETEMGVPADIGGVGIAMILLIVSSDWLHRTGRMKLPTESGITFWGAIYVPIVVAMAASQNVLAALTGGVMAICAGLLGVIACFLLVGVFSRIGSANPVEKDLS